MLKLEWLETFELGVPEIDGDHRTMLALMKAVQSAGPDRKRAARYLDRLFSFTRSHFAREETLLEGWGYPGTATHVHYHAKLLEQAAALRQICAGIETPEDYEECCKEMLTFLVDDVVSGDLKLKSFFDEAGLVLSVQ